MARQQQDIAGFRRSHKKIPTRDAMKNDQKELAAKQKAVSSMGQGGAAKAAETGPRKSLSSYQNQIQPIGMSNAGAPPLPEGAARDRAVGGMRRTPQQPIQQPDVTTTFFEESDKDEAATRDEFSWRQKLEEIGLDNLDKEAAEERIARQRAAQEATVRATFGAGEGGRSGAAALLGGEAGRMAESQARAEELAKELEVAELGSVLMNFDLAKDRYDAAEKRQAASAAMYLAQAYDVSYDEAFKMLGLPDSAKDPDAKITFDEWSEGLNRDDEGDEDEDDEPEEGSLEEEIASLGTEGNLYSNFDDIMTGLSLGPEKGHGLWSRLAGGGNSYPIWIQEDTIDPAYLKKLKPYDDWDWNSDQEYKVKDGYRWYGYEDPANGEILWIRKEEESTYA